MSVDFGLGGDVEHPRDREAGREVGAIGRRRNGGADVLGARRWDDRPVGGHVDGQRTGVVGDRLELATGVSAVAAVAATFGQRGAVQLAGRGSHPRGTTVIGMTASAPSVRMMSQ